ncbi:signal peptidase II [Noviherbaspirillum aridicola]|uniref:Lipoprotein signal peptidase n=1 Tax=Noviherbaspirillum aridicola TaxID=2849687 RepID=A0ABQ4Q3Y4_9BURK|nr:signal peptidase II [Noviherbaspirillum aridicola]GIZ51916.1 lipoprotein signal peptidase [Noviherbaspirillum aridicola]
MKLQIWLGTLKAVFVAVSVFLADIVTKAAVLQSFELNQSVAVAPFLNLGFWLNPGAAFSFLSDAGGWQRYFFTAVAVVAIAWLSYSIFFSSTISALTRVAFALIAGGAAGNLYDRLVHGAVVDWIDLHAGEWHWPAFNLADCGIVIGAALVVLASLRPESPTRECSRL